MDLSSQRGLRSFFKRAAKEGWDVDGYRNGLSIADWRHPGGHRGYNNYMADRIKKYIKDSGGLGGLEKGQAKRYLDRLADDMKQFLNGTDGTINELFSV